MHWHTAGPRACTNMHFPQWACYHRHCARSGRTRLHIGPTRPGSRNSCSSRQPLPGRFLWGRICFLRDGAPSGTRVQTCGNSMCGLRMGRGGSRWPAPGISSHYCLSTSTVHKAGLYTEVEPVCRIVFLSPWGPPEMFDQSCAVLPAARVGAYSVHLHPWGLHCCHFHPPRPHRGEIGREARSGCQVS